MAALAPLVELNPCLSLLYAETSEVELYSFDQEALSFVKKNTLKLGNEDIYTHEIPVYFGWGGGTYFLRYNSKDGNMKVVRVSQDLSKVQEVFSHKGKPGFDMIHPFFVNGNNNKPGCVSYNSESGQLIIKTLGGEPGGKNVKIEKMVELSIDKGMSHVVPILHPSSHIGGILTYCTKSGKAKICALSSDLQLKHIKDLELKPGYTAVTPCMPEFAVSIPARMHICPIQFYNKLTGELTIMGLNDDFTTESQVLETRCSAGFDFLINFIAGGLAFNLAYRKNDGEVCYDSITMQAGKITGLDETTIQHWKPNVSLISRAFNSFG